MSEPCNQRAQGSFMSTLREGLLPEMQPNYTRLASSIDPSTCLWSYCLATLLPFNHIFCDDEFVRCITDTADRISSIGVLMEGPSLEVYADVH